MANAGTLSVSILARTGRFRKGLRTVQRDLKGLRRTVFSAGGGLFAAATGGGLAFFIKQQLQGIDQAAKFADVVGLSTQELKGYQLAAKITGVEQGQLNTGIARFQKNIGDAEDGLSTAVRSLGKLNLTWEDLKNLSTDEQLKLVADRFVGLNNQIDKSSVLLNLFGRSGLPIGKLLQEGSQGIARFQAETDLLGTAFNRLDASKVELANDAMTRIQELITGIGQRIAINLAPKILAVADLFLLSNQEAGGFGAKVDQVLDSMVDKATVVLEFLKKMQLGYEVIRLAILKVGQAGAKLSSLLTGNFFMSDTSKFLDDLSGEYGKAAAESMERILKLSDEIENKTLSGKITGFMDEADKKADAIARKLKLGNVQFSESEAITTKTSDFKQIDLSRVAVGGLQGGKREQMVRDPQLQQTNQVLNRIDKKLGGQVAAVAV